MDRREHIVQYSISEPVAIELLKCLDRAFPGTPGQPASPNTRMLWAMFLWFLKTIPSWLLVLVIVLMIIIDTPIRMWQVWLVAILSLVAGSTLQLTAPARKIDPVSRALLQFDMPRTLALDQEGVHVSAGGMTRFAPWSSYYRVELAGGFVLLYRDRVADFIPIAAFEDDEEADAFARYAALRIAESTAARAGIPST